MAAYFLTFEIKNLPSRPFFVPGVGGIFSFNLMGETPRINS